MRDVALARWASDVASTVSEPVSKATEDWVEVRVGNRIERRRCCATMTASSPSRALASRNVTSIRPRSTRHSG